MLHQSCITNEEANVARWRQRMVCFNVLGVLWTRDLLSSHKKSVLWHICHDDYVQCCTKDSVAPRFIWISEYDSLYN